MTPKTMKSSLSHVNRAQIERAMRLDQVPDEARFGVDRNDSIGQGSRLKILEQNNHPLPNG
jgi:hypothetical protein